MRNKWFKEKGTQIYWLDNGCDGIMEFSFDRKKIYNLYRDYPWKLSKTEKEIFDKENPFWADYFRGRA